MTVVGAVDGQGMTQSPGSGTSTKKKSTSSEKKVSTSKHAKSSEKPVKSPTPHRSSADARIDELDQKWSNRFNRLETILLAKTVDKEPTFSTVKVAPTTSAPAGISKSTEPFIRPSDTVQTSDLAGSHNSPQSQATNKSLSSASDSQRPSTSDLHGVSQTALRAQSTSKSRKEK